MVSTVCPMQRLSSSSWRLARSMEKLSSFPEFCFYGQAVSVVLEGQQTVLLFGLSTRSKLCVTVSGHKEALVINSAVTSFVVAGSFLIYLTTAQESIYAPLAEIASVLTVDGHGDQSSSLMSKFTSVSSTWEKRRVERGSRIVTAIASTMNVVLQMPRGNLETINPRPLALEVIRLDISR
jgi:elongator complex protein 1